jgi:hypothetical protein
MIIIAIIILAVVLRLLPHLPNFAPVAAIALFSGAYLDRRISPWIPLIIMAVTDYLIVLTSGFSTFYLMPTSQMFHSTTPYVWGSFVISSFLGWFLKEKIKPSHIFSISCLASLQFFIITNFGVWASGYYEPGIHGLIESYVMGLPFFRWTLLGDLFYTGFFFGSNILVQKLFPQVKTV